MDLDQIFDGMAAASIKGKGTFLPVGFLGRVELLLLKYNAKGFNGKSVVFEYRVLESNLETVAKGGTYTQVVMLRDDNQFAMSDLKQVMFAILGIDKNTVRSPEADPATHKEATTALKEAIEDGTAIAGAEAILETKPYTIKKGGGKAKVGDVISLQDWTATPEAIAARNATLAQGATAQAA